MSTVEIRPATLDDATGLARVDAQSWREAYAGLIDAEVLAARDPDPDLWIGRLTGPDPRSARFVAVADSILIGYVAVGPELPEPGSTPGSGPDATSDRGHLYAIYLLAGWWGRGIGHRLHEQGMAALADAGFDHAILWVLDTNERAIAFYRREGWSLDEVSRVEQLGSMSLPLRQMSRAVTAGQR